jgi:hypothetical protein
MRMRLHQWPRATDPQSHGHIDFPVPIPMKHTLPCPNIPHGKHCHAGNGPPHFTTVTTAPARVAKLIREMSRYRRSPVTTRWLAMA